MTRTSRLGMLFPVLPLVGLVGCGSSGDQEQRPSITVFAAASLRNAFPKFTFAGSADLVTQRASADVFGSADTNNMVKAEQAELVAGEPVDFASNPLTIVTAPGDPKQVVSFADLVRPGLSVVVCASEVPCGSATAKVLSRTGFGKP